MEKLVDEFILGYIRHLNVNRGSGVPFCIDIDLKTREAITIVGQENTNKHIKEKQNHLKIREGSKGQV